MIATDINYADEFVQEFEQNPKEYPDSIKLFVKRYKRWTKRKDIFWDNEKANAVIYFIETFVKHAIVRLGGQPLVLESRQKFFYVIIYWMHKYNEHGRSVSVIRHD